MFIVFRISPMFQPVSSEGGLVGPLCSRNAHDKAMLVWRAQLSRLAEEDALGEK